MHIDLVAILSMLVVLGIMVFVHEFGHFAVAKLCGVRVETFSIGFGKRLFGFRHNGTDYRLSVLPLGGYVKMAGELGGDGTQVRTSPADGTANRHSSAYTGPVAIAAAAGEEELINNGLLVQSNPDGDPGDLNSHPRWQRVLIALAGPFANFVLAFFLMAAVFMAHNEVPEFLSQPAITDYVSPSSPAGRAGIQPGDRIVSFDGVRSPNWDQLQAQAALNMNQTVKVTVERLAPGGSGNSKQMLDLLLPIRPKGDPNQFELMQLGLIPIYQATPLDLGEPSAGYPAAEAGLKRGDKLISINGVPVHSIEMLSAFLADDNGKPVSLLVIPQGQSNTNGGSQPKTVVVQPRFGEDQTGRKAWRVGLPNTPYPFRVEHLSLPAAAAESWAFNLRFSTLIFEVLHRMVTLHMSVKNLSGPIGIGQQTGQAARAIKQYGFVPMAQVMSLISLNLGIFNLLPIPILDGGVILFLLIESAMRRDLNQRFKERVYQAAFVCLLLFAAFVMFNDITKLSLFRH